MRKTLPTFAALWLALLAPLSPYTQAQPGPTAAPSSSAAARVIVKYRPASTLLRKHAQSAAAQHASQAQALSERVGLALRAGAGVDEHTHVVLADGISSEQLAQRLARESDIEYAVVDQRRRRFAAPNDPLYAAGVPGSGPAVGQWYLRAPSGTVLSSIDAEAAWNVTMGNAGIVVAVIDSGVRFDHPDLLSVAAGGNLLPGYDLISDLDVANDGDARDADASDPGDWLTQAEIDLVGGPYYQCDARAADSSWHGTQMAGLIGALTNNGVGMASVGRNVRVLPVRVLGKCGGFDSDILAGMNWAAGLSVPGVPPNPNPARVLNLSLGGPGTCTDIYREAVAAINAVGAVVVASAGNSAGHAVSEPANCPGVVAVAGLRHVGTKVGFSDIGPEIAVSAPGGNCVNLGRTEPCLYPILTTANSGTTTPRAGGSIYTDSFNFSIGTSFSAPLVAGTAALMLAAQPALTAAEVGRLLRVTARPFPTTGGDNGDGTPVPVCTAPQFDNTGRPIDQDQCYCTTTTCGAGMTDAGAASAAALAGIKAAISVAPAAGTVAQPLQLSAASSFVISGRNIASYQWAIVDAGGIVSGFAAPVNGITTTVIPQGAGRFSVSLTVTDNTGRTSTALQGIDVADAPPDAGGGGGGGGGALDAPWLVLLAAAVLALRSAAPRARVTYSTPARRKPSRRTPAVAA